MNIPDTWNSLNEFANWYKLNDYPQMDSVHFIHQTDVSLSITLFRHKCYQVEFYIAKPNFLSSKHYHPFEQLIIFMGGNGQGRRGVNIDEETTWVSLNNHVVGQIQPVLKTTEWHQIKSEQNGLYFYNCQRWPNENMMSSAVVEYNGISLGPMHDRIKKSC
jgi:hypothetical protein